MSEIEEEGTQENVELEKVEAPVEEEAVLYDVSRPELIDMMLDVVEIYDQAIEGKMSIEDARARTEEVESRLKKMLHDGLVVKKKKRAKVHRSEPKRGRTSGRSRGKREEKKE
ncbi:MAG: hypothetical protein NZ902_02785 [Acidilobaceae archaeon]|nr:hypothetical protein [Acidilobaceae archaeon]MCX8165746.1 hypothetical protein [Acidilobaceae archaeon]MDW7974171.1 hypothetical protein [Sulfolobales archaeon]